jgi:uncharacterized damage-inducible protein DinB
MAAAEDGMTYYGGKEMADSFRTVRKNTIQIAEEIPEDQYGFRATPEVLSVAQELAHVACAPMWQIAAHGTDKKSFITFEDFHAYRARGQSQEQALTTKPQIVEALRRNGDEFAHFLESLSADTLAERVGFPPPVQPSSKSRFEMLLGAKEHEMHHRGKLMLIQRLLGQVPHLTRARQQMQAAASAGARS